MKIQSTNTVSQNDNNLSGDSIAKQATRIMKGAVWTYAGAENDPSIKGFALEFINSEIPYPLLHGATMRQFAAAQLGLSDVAQEPVEDLFEVMSESDDPVEQKAFAKLKAFFESELTDIKVTKYGPFDKDGGLAIDQGSYLYAVSGISKDGKVVGVSAISSET
jgi:hypothetical protein